jgi:hypothetical protein
MTLRAVKVVQSVVEVQREDEVDAVQARRQKAERVETGGGDRFAPME